MLAAGDRKVAPERSEPGAAHWAAVEHALESLLVERGEGIEHRVHEVGPRLKLWVRTDWRLAVPRADILADIAAEKPAGPCLGINSGAKRAFVFDVR